MMKIGHILCFYTLMFWSLSSFAQTKDSLVKPEIKFCSKNEFGGLIGIGRMKDKSDYLIWNPEWALELTSTNGIRYAPWFVGIGVGVRMWGIAPMFPVFGHVSLDLYKSAFFLHADMGHQFGVRKSNYMGDRETGSFFAAYGLGYNFAVRKQSFYVKASICHQKVKATGESNGLGPSNYPVHYDLTYMFARVSLGLQF